jgi:hypothetical protein
MYDIKNLNIWKQQEPKGNSTAEFEEMEIADLGLSVRSFNSLKRAGCDTVGDVLRVMGEEGEGLRRIRNLGARSEAEIKAVLEKLRAEFASRPESAGLGSAAGSASAAYHQRKIIRPAKSMWDREISEFHLSRYAEGRLRSCGIVKISDLYATNPKQEPGWYAVRELFSRIASMT